MAQDLFQQQQTTQQQISTPTPPAASPIAPPATATPTTGTPSPAGSSNLGPKLPSSKPVTRQVDPKETVMGQLTDLYTGNDNAILETARASARVQAEERGLSNSSLATQAGEQAVFSRAADIAAADAGTYERAATQNAATRNQFALGERQYQQNVDLSNLDTQQRMKLADQAFENQTKLSDQVFNQQTLLSAQGYEQALDLSVQDFREQSKLLMQEFGNQMQMSALDQQEALQQLQAEQTNFMARLGEQGRLDAVQSRLDQQEALQFERLRSDLDIVRLGAQTDNRLRELEVELQGRLDEIVAQTEAQQDVNLASDARRTQLQYLQETGAIMRQTMQDISLINTTEGLSTAQQSAAVADVRRNMQNDLAVLQSYYEQAPSWDPAWGVDTPQNVYNPGAQPVVGPPPGYTPPVTGGPVAPVGTGGTPLYRGPVDVEAIQRALAGAGYLY